MLSIIGLFIYFYDLNNPDPTQGNPFKTFDNNPGIIKISFTSLITRIVFVVCFLLLAFDKFKQDKKILTVYLFSALTIGFLQWYELYFGSTFYYGEVRDKQGLMFPLLAFFMVTLVIWKLNYSYDENRNLTTKLTLTAIVNGGLYFLWTQVYEPWKL